jgi:hypothetical protein
MATGSYGKGPWGKGPWGGGTSVPDALLNQTITITEFLIVDAEFIVDSATSVNCFQVEVNFNSPTDFSYPPVLDVANYSIPGLFVLGVSANGPGSVLLDTTEQQEITYTVTVADAKNLFGDFLTPTGHSVSFVGCPLLITFSAVAQSKRVVTLLFSQPMLQNTEFSDPASYTITDLQGNLISITSVSPFGPSPISRLSISLGSDLTAFGYYVATVTDPLVQSVTLRAVDPNTDLFQWTQQFTFPMQIPISSFTGEVTGGLLGQPLGQVFFSPSLLVAAPNSAIQIDEVSVCTRAYDVYSFPSIPDPKIFSTHGGGLVATYEASLLNDAGRVTYASFSSPRRLNEARFDFNFTGLAETMPTAVDGPADATLYEPLDPTFVSYLGDFSKVLFDGIGMPVTTADNLAPIPPGATTNINLQP